MTSETVGFSTIDALRLTTDFGTEKYLIEGDELTLSASTNYEGSTYAWYGRESGGTYSQIGDGETVVYHWEYSTDGTYWSQATNEYSPEDGEPPSTVSTVTRGRCGSVSPWEA